jgi:hypothetical protein
LSILIETTYPRLNLGITLFIGVMANISTERQIFIFQSWAQPFLIHQSQAVSIATLIPKYHGKNCERLFLRLPDY